MDYEEFKKAFEAEVRADKKATELYTKIYNGKGTYKTAAELATRVGNDFGKVLKANDFMLTPEEWALDDFLPRALGLDHEMMIDACRTVQDTMNKDAGLGIKYKEPKFNFDRVNGLITELTEHPEFKDIEASFYDQLVNFTMNVVDDSIRDNAAVMYRAGIRTMVIRQAEFGGCAWCQEQAGTYDYNEVKDYGNDVWRRHENCRCTIDYITERNSSLYRETVNNFKK
jgi:hypothetical protein